MMDIIILFIEDIPIIGAGNKFANPIHADACLWRNGLCSFASEITRIPELEGKA